MKLSSKLPPGPHPLPIVGNLFHLSNNPHRSLAKLSKFYDPIMTLKIGRITTIVVSSVDMAREIFQLFTKKHLDSTQLLRHKKVAELLGYVGECCQNGKPINIGRAAFTTSLNLLYNTFFSIDLAGYSGSSQEFKDLTHNIMDVLGKPNLADGFHVLRYFDLFGIRFLCRNAEMFVVFDDINKKKLSAAGPSSLLAKDDVLGTLLKTSKEDGSDLSLVDIKHLLLQTSSWTQSPTNIRQPLPPHKQSSPFINQTLKDLRPSDDT
ncbi:hypothetical protein V2J09_014030 [Rumex salicifolius]